MRPSLLICGLAAAFVPVIGHAATPDRAAPPDATAPQTAVPAPVPPPADTPGGAARNGVIAPPEGGTAGSVIAPPASGPDPMPLIRPPGMDSQGPQSPATPNVVPK